MVLKDVVKKIMESKDLKAKLSQTGSFREVHEIFRDNGYEGGEQELKEVLFKGTVPFHTLRDEDLMNVAGGVSGRQVLSACASLMMLMGVAPVTNYYGYAAGTSVQSAAVKNQKLDEIKELCKKDPDFINKEDKFGLTPLHNAVKNKDFDIVKYLVENGADVNAKSMSAAENLIRDNKYAEAEHLFEAHSDWSHFECGKTPLMYAAERGDLDIAKYLVEHGADINARGEAHGRNVLYFSLATKERNIDLVKYLVDQGADVNAEDIVLGSPLDIAIDYADLHANEFSEKYWDANRKGEEALKEFLESDTYKSYVQSRNEDEQFALDVIKCLVEHGANVNAHHSAPLYDALQNGYDSITKYLIDCGTDVNAKNEYIGTPLHRAYTEFAVKYLIEHGADVNARDDSDATPLNRAGSLEKIKILVEHGADVNNKDKFGFTPLSFVMGVDEAKYLVEHGASIQGAKHLLSEHAYTGKPKDINLVKYFVENGADANEGIGAAVRSGNLELVKYLVEHGADVNSKADGYGASPIDYAVGFDKEPNMDLVNYLVDHGADVNDGLSSVAWNGNMDLINYFLEKGANANEGIRSVVEIGRRNGKFDLVRYLVDHSKDINAKDSDGKTPLGRLISRYNAWEREGEKKSVLDNLKKEIEYLRSKGAKE